MHALQEFAIQHAQINKLWHKESNYLAFLAAKDEADLFNLAEEATKKGINFSLFREPDIDNQLTAIALEPGIKSKKLCRDLKLAGR